MALLAPFRALRPTPEAAAHVAAVPYDVVSAEEAAALASGNPLSFLRISRAEIDLPPDTNPYSETVYRKAKENFDALKKTALVVEEAPSLYVYRLRMGSSSPGDASSARHEQVGVVACFSLEEYERDAIRKHERTRRDKEDDRTRHMLELRAQTGPVFLTYKASPAVDAIVARSIASRPPLFDFTAADGVQHTIWRVEARDEHDLLAAFGRVPALYIADGHHRAASAARARQQLRGNGSTAGEWDTFLAVAFPDNQMQILPYNRVVKDLASFTADTLLAAIGERFVVTNGPARPVKRGTVAMYLDGRWHTIVLGDASESVDAAERLDVQRLQNNLLAPLLGIGDVRSDKRIDFVGGARGTGELEKLVNSGRAAVAFSLYPVDVGDLMAISDAGAIMPPKSTWFEPKLRDGLLSHVI
jgi:uncharacterized protein (DUF1015 family)